MTALTLNNVIATSASRPSATRDICLGCTSYEDDLKLAASILEQDIERLGLPKERYSIGLDFDRHHSNGVVGGTITVEISSPQNNEKAIFRVSFGEDPLSGHYRAPDHAFIDYGIIPDPDPTTYDPFDPKFKGREWITLLKKDDKAYISSQEMRACFQHFLFEERERIAAWCEIRKSQLYELPELTAPQKATEAQARLSLSSTERALALGAFCREVQDFYPGLREQPVIGARFSDQGIGNLIDELFKISGCRDMDHILEILRPLMLEQYREGHPRSFIYVGSSPSDAISVIASGLAALYNPFGGTLEEARGPVEAEKALIRKMAKEMFHFEEDTVDGLFLSGGTLALETVLQAAFVKGFSNKLEKGGIKKDNDDKQAAVWRNLRRKARFYTSSQFNSAIGKALRSLGFYINISDPKNSQLRIIETNKDFTLSHEDLKKAVEDDVQSKLWPCGVIFNMGSTSTGAIDDVSKSADFCRKHGIYMVGDATYGGGIALCRRGNELLSEKGINLLDALTYGPQKLGGQPFGNVAVIAKRRRDLEIAHQLPRYSVVGYQTGVGNPCDLGKNFTRAMEGLLQVLLTEAFYGPDEQARSVETLLELTDYVKKTVLKHPSLELTSEPGTTVATFRFKSSEPVEENTLNKINEMISKLVYQTEYAAIGTTDLKLNKDSETKVLRMCLVNPNTIRKDIEASIGLALVIGQALWDKEKGELKSSSHYKQELVNLGLLPDQFKISEVIESIINGTNTEPNK